MTTILVTDVVCERCGFVAADWFDDRCHCCYCGLIWRHYMKQAVVNEMQAKEPSKKRMSSGRFAGMTAEEIALQPNGPEYLEFIGGDVK